MASILTFDELNVLDHENRRSEDYDEYFSGMGLTKAQKQRRIELSEKFEEEFWAVLVYLFALFPLGLLTEDTAKEKFLVAYLLVYEAVFGNDDYGPDYADKFASEVAKSTLDHVDDPYYFSKDRAMYLSENESETAYNHDEFEKALLNGKRYKQWVSMKDFRVRGSHRIVDDTVKLIQEPFVVGDSLMMYPKDTSFDADPEEIVNCRCIVKYI